MSGNKEAAAVIDRENPVHGAAALEGWQGKAVLAIAIVFTFYQIVTAAFSPLPTMVLRSVHVGFLLALAYFLFRFRKRDQGSKAPRSEEHTSELQSLMRISYAVFCLKKKTYTINNK